MAKKGKGYSGTPECTSFSFEKKSIPGGGPEPVKLSATKKLAGIGGGPDRGRKFTPEEVFRKL